MQMSDKHGTPMKPNINLVIKIIKSNKPNMNPYLCKAK